MLGIRGPALALLEFRVTDVSVEPEEPIVKIKGRKAGFFGWLLTIMGIDATTTLIVTSRDVSFKQGSLFGEITSMMPTTAVASAHSGFAKPIAYLILAGILTLVGIISVASVPKHGVIMLLVALGLSLILLIAYALNKKMALFVESNGGTIFGLVFKRSVIEGVTVDIDKVRKVVKIVREVVITSQSQH